MPTTKTPRSTVSLRSIENRADGAIEVLQISDLHLLPEPNQTLLGVNTEETAGKVFEFAKSKLWPPDLIVLTGDLAQEPLSVTYERLNRFLESLDVSIVCLPGNHDDPQMMAQQLQSENVHCVSQILTSNWQIICLDSSVPGSNGGHFSDATFEILEDHLDQYPEKFALVCLHHHPVPIDCLWLDTMVLDNRKEFFTILQSRSQSRAIVCGHIHQDLNRTHQKLQVFGTPSTCFQFKPGSEKFVLDNQAPGYRRLSLYPDGTIKSEVLRLAELPKGLDLASAGY